MKLTDRVKSELFETIEHFIVLYQTAKKEGVNSCLDYDATVTFYRHPSLQSSVLPTSPMMQGGRPKTPSDLGVMVLRGVDLNNVQVINLHDALELKIIQRAKYEKFLKQYGI